MRFYGKWGTLTYNNSEFCGTYGEKIKDNKTGSSSDVSFIVKVISYKDNRAIV